MDASVHRDIADDDRGVNTCGLCANNSTSRVLHYYCTTACCSTCCIPCEFQKRSPVLYSFSFRSEQQPSASRTSAPVEPQSTDSEPQSVLPPPHKPLHPPTPPHPYRIYGYKLNNEWFAKFAKDHNIGKPDWDVGAIESGVLGYLTRLPGFQIHFVDDPSVPVTDTPSVSP